MYTYFLLLEGIFLHTVHFYTYHQSDNMDEPSCCWDLSRGFSQKPLYIYWGTIKRRLRRINIIWNNKVENFQNYSYYLSILFLKYHKLIHWKYSNMFCSWHDILYTLSIFKYMENLKDSFKNHINSVVHFYIRFCGFCLSSLNWILRNKKFVMIFLCMPVFPFYWVWYIFSSL